MNDIPHRYDALMLPLLAELARHGASLEVKIGNGSLEFIFNNLPEGSKFDRLVQQIVRLADSAHRDAGGHGLEVSEYTERVISGHGNNHPLRPDAIQHDGQAGRRDADQGPLGGSV